MLSIRNLKSIFTRELKSRNSRLILIRKILYQKDICYGQISILLSLSPFYYTKDIFWHKSVDQESSLSLIELQKIQAVREFLHIFFGIDK